VPSLRRALAFTVLALATTAASASFESWKFDEVYSNVDGTLQYVVLKESQGVNGMSNLAGLELTATHLGVTKSYHFGLDLPSLVTAGKRVLIATQAVAATGLVTPDYIMPDRFLPTDGGSLIYANTDSFNYNLLPTDGVNALFTGITPGPIIGPNIATNFAGQSASIPAGTITVVEYYHAAFDHYFMTPLSAEIDALDTGRFSGWSRTGYSFKAYPSQASAGADANPVCRFYIPPQHGDSHFYSASPFDCTIVLQKIGTDPSFSGYIEETPSAFYIALPNITTGACPTGTIPVYRLWNHRFDSNHRFTTDPIVKALMQARGYIAEGYGPGPTSMCANATALPFPQFQASAASPFAPGCDGVAATGVLFQNAEVEPMLAINPTNPANLVGVWQQDRWSDGGSHGVMTGYSFDGGRTWARSAAALSRCAGGNAANGGDYDRASDPWVTFAPDGTAYQISLSFSGQENQPGASSAVLVSRSVDGGISWSSPITLIRDGPAAFNDKESVTADSTDARFVYATWDRLAGNLGPTYFARTTDGGATWEPARAIFDPGADRQTLNNQIVVLPNGTLINFFTLFNPNPTLAVIRSTDKGVTWSAPITIAQATAVGAQDPETGTDVRDSATLGSIAVSRQGVLVAAWQDSRFFGGARDGIAVSRSTDGGLTWSAPVRVNFDGGVSAFSPAVTVRDDGMIGVTYYDFRKNTADPTSLPTDFWITQSSDGVNWIESHVAGPFDLSIAPNALGLFLGDYFALTSIGTTFVPFFVETNNGNLANRTDVFASLVPSAGMSAKAAAESASGRGAPMLAQTASPWVMTPEIAQRLQATAQRVLERRRSEHGGRAAVTHP
jgi:hypothetical protein